MTVKPLILALFVSLSMPAFSGQMYEWRDPATGRLMLGDKPPRGVKYWEEGERSPGELAPKPAKPKPPAPTTEAFKIDYEEMKNEVQRNFELFRKAQNSLGISQEEFLKERRPPNKINTTVVRGMKKEQWIYDQGYGKEYYYFTNGILDAVQN
ncbi:MAG: DUF4124 domain-containing protein [Gammaproteobacteria bacterium]|nr:DUF4124 domain-containing protein [Gammaproteobacteria bacterium]